MCKCNEIYCAYCQCNVEEHKSVPKYPIWVAFDYAKPIMPKVAIEIKGEATSFGSTPDGVYWCIPTHWRIKDIGDVV